MGVSETTIYRRTKVGEWITRVESTGKRGQPRKNVLLSSLPEKIQLEWFKRQQITAAEKCESVIEDLAISEDGQSTPPCEIDPLDQLQSALSRFSMSEREIWINELNRLSKLIQRYENISPKRIKNSSGKYEFVQSVFNLCEEAVCKNQTILERYPHRGETPSPYTMDGWLRDYKKNGLCAFIRPASTTNSEDSRKAKISQDAFDWVNQNWRKYRSARHLFKEIKKLAKRKEWQIPSEAWFYRRWQELPKVVLTHHLLGEKAYQSKHAPYIPRDASDLRALELLCGDHSVRDVTVIWRDGKTLIRPWLTLWQDLRTGLIWGWHLDIKPSSRTIALAYADGVRNFGAQPPNSFVYTDRGRDYKSVHLDGSIEIHKAAANLDGGLDIIRIQQNIGVYAAMEVQRYLARARNAKEKPIERTHLDISNWEANTFDDWCGRDAKNKPDSWVKMWHEHQAFVRGKRKDSPFIHFQEYLEALAGWIVEYNRTEHERSVLGGAKIVPLDEFQLLYETHYTISEESLTMLLMKAESRIIGKIGVTISAGHKTWRYFNPAMSAFKGKQVEVRYDDNDLDRVWVFLPDGQLCEAELVQKAGYLTPNKQTAKLMKTTERRERNMIRDHNLLTQAMIRGDSLEERIAAEYEIEEPQELPIAAEAGGGGRAIVHKLTRMDRPKLKAVPTRNISASEVSQISNSENFNSSPTPPPTRGRVRLFDFDDEE